MRELATVALALDLALGAVATGTSQEPTTPVFVYEGKPIRLPIQCVPADLEALGLSCPAEAPCDVFLELNSVEAVGARIFLTGNLHTTSTTLYSILLGSTDGGRSWQELHPRILNASLDRIQFLDYLNGWISGQLLHPIPHDPFFLRTTDGGTSWWRHDVLSERKYGFIEWFRFETPARGRAWIDRTQVPDAGSAYELYESEDGGRTWTLRRGVSEFPDEASTRSPAPELVRLRVDEAEQAFVLERNSEGQWQTVASFAIRLGECLTPGKPLPEPPGESEPAGAAPAAAPRKAIR